MLKIENLSFSYPDKDLYKNISFTLEQGQHAAFIGTNGSGKSTLIDMLLDPDKYMYDGKIEMSPEYRIGYVQQFSDIDKARELTVFEYIGEEFIRLQNEITSICTQMETATDIEPLLEKYQETLDAFQAINGDNFEDTITRTLNLANLANYKNMMIGDLSGGEFKLVQVIRAMLLKPELIIMDEPDVFLDFDNLNSLKNLIISHEGTLLVITHNRYILNHCFDKIIHLENKEVQEFEGNYIDYNFSLLETKIELQELAAADTAEIERNEILIEGYRELASENAEQFRGKTLRARVKIQERLEARRIKAPFVDIKQPNIVFDTDKEIADEIALKVKGYNLAFDEVLLENTGLEIKGNEKLAIVGANGTGKTSLLQDIAKNDNPAIQFGENTDIAYLSQIPNVTLKGSNSIYDEFFDLGFKSYDQIKEYLIEYGFTNEKLEQKIESLSGGEKGMLQIAKVGASNATMLVLDEPTSHLDTYSQMALEKAIKNFKGAVLMVSHDFYTIVNCMNAVLMVEDKKIERMNIKRFREMIYTNHFNKNYLEVEHQKKSLETRIELALKDENFELAKTLAEELEPLVKLLNK